MLREERGNEKNEKFYENQQNWFKYTLLLKAKLKEEAMFPKSSLLFVPEWPQTLH